MITRIEGPRLIKEGTTFKLRVFTSYGKGKIIYWRHTGTGLTNTDLATPLSGKSITDSQGRFEIKISVNNDNMTEQSEDLSLEFFSKDLKQFSYGDFFIGGWGSIPIQDTSKRIAGTKLLDGTWKRQNRFGIFDSVYKFTANSRTSFVVAVDSKGGDPYSTIGQMVQMGSWRLKDQHWNVIADSNNNGRLDDRDKVIGNYYDGRDGIVANSGPNEGFFTVDSNANISLLTSRKQFMGTATIDEAFRIFLGQFPINKTIKDTLYISKNARLGSKIKNAFATGDDKVAITGNSQSNNITGNGNSNTLIGGKKADFLTGLGGADTFRYISLSDSKLAAYDRITDFAIGTDRIDAPTAVNSANVRQLGRVNALTQREIGKVLTNKTFQANRAATFTFGSGSNTRTFLALNDNRAGFDSARDGLIEITGYSGNLGNLAIV